MLSHVVRLALVVGFLLAAPLAAADPDPDTLYLRTTTTAEDCISFDVGPPPYAVIGHCNESVANFTIYLTTEFPP